MNPQTTKMIRENIFLIRNFQKKIDLLVVFGGDGTLLNSARQYLEYEIPILGVNMGNVGFLTDIKVENFHTSMQEILDGDYKIEERNLVSENSMIIIYMD